jgi:HlyD family secretion protein
MRNNKKEQPGNGHEPGDNNQIVTRPASQSLSVIKRTGTSLKEWCNNVVSDEKYNRKLTKMLYYIDRSAHYMSNGKSDEHRNEVMQFARPSIVFGIWTLIIVFGFFGLWSAIAPLDSAAVAKGTIVVSSSKKTIQHLEGGIIREILVKEGDSVKAGQPLIRLSETAAKSRYETLISQYYASLALENRLIAERDNHSAVTFSQELLDSKNPEAANAVTSQEGLFITRKDQVNGKIAVLNQRKAQFVDQIKGLEAQQLAAQGQLKLVKDEINIVDTLLKSGNANRPRLLALQRRQAELQGIRGQYLSEIAKARQSITEAEMEIINTRNDRLNDIMKELRETQVLVADLREKVKAATDVADRLIITAPTDGVVNGLIYHTIGGVIAPGTPIMDIIPQNDKLVIDAQVLPQNIDEVHTGLTARIRLTGFRSRTTPIVEGKVVTVSADKFTDKANPNLSYYIARVEIDKIPHGLKEKLYPGMPADVLIVTGTRTFLHYLLGPISDTLNNAFREQ